jgi:hypothetical protein
MHAAEIMDEHSLAVANAKRPENRISVAEYLRAPCALVSEARIALKHAEPDAAGILQRPAGCLDLRVSRALLPRALRIADALLKAIADQGWEVTLLDGSTFVQVGQALIALTLEEATKTVEVPAKPDPGNRFFFRHNIRVRKPSGQLSIAIRERHHLWSHTQQRNWRESEKRVLEKRLNGVIVGMLELASAVEADMARREREAREEQERQRKLQAALDEQRRLRAALVQEKANVEHLLDQAVRWRESRHLRLFIEQVRERGAVPELELQGQELIDWIQWALRQADRLDPFKPSPPSILDDADRIEHMCDDLRGHR